MQAQKKLVEDVIRETITGLEQQGYNASGSRKYITIYRALAQFSRNRFSGEYSHEIGEAFIQSLRERIPPLSVGFFRSNAVAIERINHIMEGDYNWHPGTKQLEYENSVHMKEAILYEEYLRNSGKIKSDVRSRMHIVTRFLRYIETRGVTKLSEISAHHIYGAFQCATDKGGFHKAVGAFLKYAHRHMLTAQNLSVLIPSIGRHVPVPSVYSLDEVEKIIDASVQSKLCGRRNRVIVLLAARLGLRSCDIANLQFGNINGKRQTIEITQTKTKVPLLLPLLPEINDALNNYIEHERIKSDVNYIFLRVTPPLDEPIQPQTIYSIVSRIIEIAGIDTNGRKHGPHSLRSSLATALLNEGNSHYAIQEALGQTSPNAVKSYIKTDVENLRDYALSVPKPFGSFAANLGLGVRV